MSLPKGTVPSLLALVLAAALEPHLGLHPPAFVVVALALGFLWSLATSAQGWDERVVAIGLAAALLGLGWDRLRGHQGMLALVPGDSVHLMEEEGPSGRSIGLRPLPFALRLERQSGNEASVSIDGEAVEVQRGVSLSRRGFRLAWFEDLVTGQAGSLRLRVSEGGQAREVDIAPGVSRQSGDLTIDLEQYFPDFALDERGQPFSKTDEPRNPAALLRVGVGGRAFRVFVIRAIPGIHRPTGLDAAFSLLDVEPARGIRIRVTSEPAGGVVGAGIVACIVGLCLRWPSA